jgi:hypothetical protein
MSPEFRRGLYSIPPELLGVETVQAEDEEERVKAQQVKRMADAGMLDNELRLLF